MGENLNRISYLGTVIAILFFGIADSFDGMENNNSSELIATNSSNSRHPSPLVVVAQPTKPKASDCFGYFPGTPQWNACVQRFNQDMAEFQTKMHEFVKNRVQSENGQQHFSESSMYNSNSMSTSNSYVGGYAIRAVNMVISTTINNNILRITLGAGPIDKFESKVNGNEIQMNVMSKGNPKWVKILVPDSVSMRDVIVDRNVDAIYITAPVADAGGAGNYQMSQTQSSSSGSLSTSGNFYQNMGQPPMQIPPVPIPDFSNMFQNIFQTTFQNIFGARSIPQRPRPREFAPYYSPMVWFY